MSGNIFVLDEGNNRIQKFDSNGNFITKWGTVGSGDGQFNEPTGIAIRFIREYICGRSEQSSDTGICSSMIFKMSNG